MFDRSKLESLRDVSVTRIGDTFPVDGFPQTELRGHTVERSWSSCAKLIDDFFNTVTSS